MNEQHETFGETKRGTEEGQTKLATTGRSTSKTHQDFWKPRLRRRVFKGRDGVPVEIPEWQVRMKHLRREAWFNLDTANQSVAAIKARDIYVCLVSTGWDAALARYKATAAPKVEVCTVGEFLADVEQSSGLKAKTVRRYAVKLRKMVADLAKLEVAGTRKSRMAKYDYINGGRQAWLAKIDGQKLDILTNDTINAWRNAYVLKAGNDPLMRKSAERSAASYLRCSRALFTNEILRHLTVRLPSNPFAGVRIKAPRPQRYQSEINPAWLLDCAGRELRNEHPQQYLALFLCLWAGLRRIEADLLMWKQVDLESGVLTVRRTAFFEPKTDESERTIDLSPMAIDVLRSFKNGNRSEFVLVGADPKPASTYDFYRCDCDWRDLHAWLRAKGVTQSKAIHSLRKESGSLIASVHGIEAARQHLGHVDIRTTSAHYVSKKKRVEIDIPMTLPGQLVELPQA